MSGSSSGPAGSAQTGRRYRMSPLWEGGEGELEVSQAGQLTFISRTNPKTIKYPGKQLERCAGGDVACPVGSGVFLWQCDVPRVEQPQTLPRGPDPISEDAVWEAIWGKMNVMKPRPSEQRLIGKTLP